MIRTCPQCERSFTPNVKHQVYESQECRQQGWVEKEVLAAQAELQRVEHPLQGVREAQEAAKAEWSAAIYAEIVRLLQVRGHFHADDLEPMGIPDEHRNLIGAQLGSLAARQYIHEVGRRRSANPARKQAKSGVYELTRVGRERLAEVGAGHGDRVGTGSSPAAAGTGRASADLAEPLSLLPDGAGRAQPQSAFTTPEAA